MATQHKKGRRCFKKLKAQRTAKRQQEQLPMPRSYAEFCAMTTPKRKRNKHRLHDLFMAHSIMSMGRRASHKRGHERKAGRMIMAVKGDWNTNGIPFVPLVNWQGSIMQRGRKRNRTTLKSLNGMAYPLHVRKVDDTKSIPVYGNNPLPRIEDITISALSGNPHSVAMNRQFNEGVRWLRNLNRKQQRIMSA